MKLTAKVKLLPTDEQAVLLKKALETANDACNAISQVAWDTRTFRQFQLHKLTYSKIREIFPLTAQVVVRCICKVADGYRLDTKKQRIFRKHGAITYDDRILNWRLTKQEVSIWCLDGRQVIPFVCGSRQYDLLRFRHGEADLALIDGKFYLFATCEIEVPEPIDVSDMVGVDLGVTNIAVDSSGHVYSSSQVNNVRYRNRRLRQKLQKKGTKSAKRLLKKRSKKESRFACDVNHTISKRIVEHAQGTGCGIALEDLKYIRTRITARKRQRATLHSWSFNQLRQFIHYKAQRVGIPVALVDPRNTSRTCPRCGCVDKRNRPNQSTFSCIVCGFSGLADSIAAENIRVLGRASVNMPHVSPSPGESGRDKLSALADSG